MTRRRLGNSTLEITPIGLGAWAMGGSDWPLGWGPQPDVLSLATIQRAIDRGINWIDTSAVYGLGRAETIIARALRDVSPDDRPYVFTKGGLVWDDLGNVSCSIEPASLRRQAEDSLRRLGVDAIDLYQLDLCPVGTPWPCAGGFVDDAWATLDTLRAEGKVRFIGITNADRELLARLERIAPITSLQAPYSLLNRDIETTLPFCERHEIGVIANSAMASGLLTGSMTPERLRQLPHNDWRRRNAFLRAAAISLAPGIVERLRDVGDRHAAIPGAVAVAWTLRHRAITAAVVGARRPEQIAEVGAAATMRLTMEETDRIEGIAPHSLVAMR
jgi:aryl-alcohol dehydrogenase-like predicted oxidoreductase